MCPIGIDVIEGYGDFTDGRWGARSGVGGGGGGWSGGMADADDDVQRRRGVADSYVHGYVRVAGGKRDGGGWMEVGSGGREGAFVYARM